MAKKRIYLFLMLLALHSVAMAQQKALLKFGWNLRGIEFNANTTIIEAKPVMKNKTANPLIFKNIKSTLPKAAVFCRMEDALHKHFNIWIKVRMGDDDRYSN